MCKDSSAKYYKYNKERLQKRLMKDIKVFFKKEKKKKQQYCCELYRNLPEDEEYSLAEYRKKKEKIAPQ